MGDQTLFTEHTLDKKRYKDGVKLNTTFVTAVADEAALLPTGALNLEELQAVNYTVINFLGKIIAYIKDNCYHNIGSGTKGHGSWCCQWKDRTALKGLVLSFLGSPSSMKKLSKDIHEAMIT